MDFGFGPLFSLAMFVQFGLFVLLAVVLVLLVIVLLDLRNFLREGTRLMGRVDRFLSRKESSD